VEGVDIVAAVHNRGYNSVGYSPVDPTVAVAVVVMVGAGRVDIAAVVGDIVVVVVVVVVDIDVVAAVDGSMAREVGRRVAFHLALG